MLEALRVHTGVSTGTPSSSIAGEAGSTVGRSHITGLDPHSGNLRFDPSYPTGMPPVPEAFHEVARRNAGSDANDLPMGDGSQVGQVSSTYSADTVPTPSPVTTDSSAVAAAPSPAPGGSTVAAGDESVRAGLHNQSVALQAWSSAPAPSPPPTNLEWF